jgi:hypothetical protein
MLRLIGFQTKVIFILFLILTAFNLMTAETTDNNNQSKRENQTRMNKNKKNDEAPFACNVGALNKDQRARYSILTKQLISEKQEVRELSDGYAFRFAGSSEHIKDLAEFITYERLCCPFFDFDLTVERNEGSLSLKLRGREGVIDFIKSEFGI